MWESYITGLVVCGGIIMAIGAQNAYILGLAIRREYHWWSAGLCISADIILLTAGMFGVSAFLLTMPNALEAMRWVGVVFLSWLAAQALFRAFSGRQGLSAEAGKARSLTKVILWFSLLAWGGAALSPWLSKPIAWRVIDGLIGMMMAGIAIHLALGAASLS